MPRLKSVVDDVDALRHQIEALKHENYELRGLLEHAKAQAAEAKNDWITRQDTLDAYESKNKKLIAAIKDLLLEDFGRKRGIEF